MAEVSLILRRYDLYRDKVIIVDALHQAASVVDGVKGITHSPSLAAIEDFVDELRLLASPNREREI